MVARQLRPDPSRYDEPDGRCFSGTQRRRHWRPSRGDDRGHEHRYRDRRRPARAPVRRHPRALCRHLRHGRRRHRRRRFDAALRLVRPGELPRLGLQRRHLARRASSTSSRRARSSRRRRPATACSSGPRRKPTLSSFLGIPYVYNYVELGNNCTPWSPESVDRLRRR